MEKIIEHILKYIMEERELPEEFLYAFSQETEKIVRSRQIESIPELFWELENYVGMFWRGEKFNYVEKPYIIYQMGRLLSFTNMICMVADEKEKELSIEDYAIQWRDRYSVFKFIHEQKGITHKALAKAVNMSPSSLSQFMTKVKWEGFFACRLMGREKHYYLTDYGEQLYEFMKQQEDKFSSSSKIVNMRKRKLQYNGDNMMNQEKDNNANIMYYKEKEWKFNEGRILHGGH